MCCANTKIYHVSSTDVYNHESIICQTVRTFSMFTDPCVTSVSNTVTSATVVTMSTHPEDWKKVDKQCWRKTQTKKPTKTYECMTWFHKHRHAWFQVLHDNAYFPAVTRFLVFISVFYKSNEFLSFLRGSSNFIQPEIYLSSGLPFIFYIFSMFSYLLKIVLSELVCNAEQLATGVCICKGPDAETVGGIQLPLEELTAGLLNLSQLEQASCREQSLNVPLLYRHLGAERSGHQNPFR